MTGKMGLIKDTFNIIAGIVILLVFITGAIFLAVGMIDNLTIEGRGIQEVPCIDKYGRPFQDELCEKVITCSALGLSGDFKCGEDE